MAAPSRQRPQGAVDSVLDEAPVLNLDDQLALVVLAGFLCADGARALLDNFLPVVD
jgi:hypothetical protein